VLWAAPDQLVEAPPALPEARADGTTWHPATRAWWARLWGPGGLPSFLTPLEADVAELLVLAVLLDQFWRAPGHRLAGEIRLQAQAFGLTPLDRARLLGPGR
jgi:hypothetical protein